MKKVAPWLLAFLFIVPGTQAANYYLSTSGNDRADGRTQQTAWQSLARLQKARILPGDSVFFHRGDTFVGSLALNASGTEQRPIVLTAYGIGKEPVLSGGIQVTNWKPIGNGKFSASVTLPVTDVYVNDVWQTPARHPNSGFFTVDEVVQEKSEFRSRALTQPDGYWNGSTLRIRTIDWVYEIRAVAGYQNGSIRIGAQSRYPIEQGFGHRSENGKTLMYNLQKGYGFYLESPAALDSAGEWAWQNGTLTLQLPEGQAPDKLQVRAVVHQAGLALPLRAKHVHVHGLAFAHYEKAGLYSAPHAEGIRVENGHFSNIHQVGIWIDSASQHCRIAGNQVCDVLGRGISAQEAKHLLVEANEVRRIGLKRAQGWTGVNGASAILIHNIERKIQTDTTFACYNVVRQNTVDSCGYNGIRVDGHHNLVEYNRIEHCSLTLNDGANLYCFAAGPGVTHHSIFRKNLVRYSIGDSQATPNNPNLAFGIYLDNNSYGMLVEDNIVINTGAAGIVNNDASFDNVIRGNLVYDCQQGIGFAEWANVGKVHSCIVEGNTVVGLKKGQQLINFTNWLAPQLEVGRLANNRYYHAQTSAPFHLITKQSPEATRLDLSFRQWQRIVGEEGGLAVTPATPWAKGYAPVLLVNDTFAEKTFVLDGPHLTLDGQPAAERYTLPPHGAVVLLKK